MPLSDIYALLLCPLSDMPLNLCPLYLAVDVM